MADARILVVYYSRTGTTRKVAKSLAAALHCDSEEVVETSSRSGMFGYLRSVIDARRQVPSRIVAGASDPSLYDLIVIGTPVWAWSLSSPVRAYLLANKPRLPAVAFFCTLGGAGSDQAFGQMLGPDFLKLFLTVKRYELARFRSHITDWERNEYLEVF